MKWVYCCMEFVIWSEQVNDIYSFWMLWEKYLIVFLKLFYHFAGSNLILHQTTFLTVLWPSFLAKFVWLDCPQSRSHIYCTGHICTRFGDAAVSAHFEQVEYVGEKTGCKSNFNYKGSDYTSCLFWKMLWKPVWEQNIFLQFKYFRVFSNCLFFRMNCLSKTAMTLLLDV